MSKISRWDGNSFDDLRNRMIRDVYDPIAMLSLNARPSGQFNAVVPRSIVSTAPVAI